MQEVYYMHIGNNIVQKILFYSLIIAVLSSFYLFIEYFLGDKKKMLNTWQFPMILAVFLDTLLVNWSF